MFDIKSPPPQHPRINAGHMRTRFIPMKPKGGTGAFGDPKPDDYADQDWVWGGVEYEPRPSEEMEHATGQAARVEAFVHMRFYEGIDATWRMRDMDTGEVYNIVAVFDMDRRRRKHVLKCYVVT